MNPKLIEKMRKERSRDRLKKFSIVALMAVVLMARYGNAIKSRWKGANVLEAPVASQSHPAPSKP